MIAATKVKMSGSVKKKTTTTTKKQKHVNRNTNNIFSIKRVTRRFLEV